MNGKVLLNGRDAIRDADTLADFMTRRGYDSSRKGVAVAVNDEVVPRSLWESTPLKDGDRLEVVEPVQGG